METMMKNINRQSFVRLNNISQLKSSYDEKQLLVTCFICFNLQPIIYIEPSNRKIKKGKFLWVVIRPTMLYGPRGGVLANQELAP